MTDSVRQFMRRVRRVEEKRIVEDISSLLTALKEAGESHVDKALKEDEAPGSRQVGANGYFLQLLILIFSKRFCFPSEYIVKDIARC